MKPIKIETLADIAALSTDQFERFLCDLEVWFLLIKNPPPGLSVNSAMDWFDDGVYGQVREVNIIYDGKTIDTVKNPDFDGPGDA